ncbi:FeoB-associated Cys-rich membrane protein [Streptococcus ictaluri]|nr:hypothetical protein [Streptococcus ictaluri]
MSTLIIGCVLLLLVVISIRYAIKQKGSCGDCHCSCPVKKEMTKKR